MKKIINKALVIRLILAIIIMTSLPAGQAQAAWTDDLGSWFRNAVAPTALADKADTADKSMGKSLATVQGIALLFNSQPLIDVVKVYTTYVTAYSSSMDETDSTPFITASGHNTHDGIAAANFLPFGTRIRIPEIFGDKVFVVEDRMAQKHNGKVDIWFPSKNQALAFGRKQLTVEVLDPAFFQ